MASEKSVKSSYTVIYNLRNKKWVVAGEGGWSEIHLCRDSIDGTHRLLAWTCSEEQDVLMNCNVTSDCVYKEKSNNFHSFTDENGDRFGLGFHKSEAGLKQAAELLQSVTMVVEECKMAEAAAREAIPAVPPPVPSVGGGGVGSGYAGGPPPRMSAIGTGGGGQSVGLPRMPSPGPHPGSQRTSAAASPPPVPPAVPSSSGGGGGVSIGGGSMSPRARPNPPKAASPRASTSPRSSPARPPPPMSSYGGGQSAFSTQDSISATFNNLSALQTDRLPMESYEFATGGMDTAMSPVSPQALTSQRTEHSMPLPSRAAPVLGDLVILPPKPQKQNRSDANVKLPHAVSHVRHVSYDHEQGIYVGLPPEWMEELNKQFGVRPTDLQGIQLQYPTKIPKVLVDLRSKLMEKEGFKVKGIFRLAPNAEENDAMKQHINRGQFSDSPEMDVSVYANLIKVWFRDLPDPLFSCVDPDLIESVNTVEDAGRVMMSFPEPNSSILLWLCDMCVEIASFEEINKMGAQNLAIVVGPNLFNTDSIENPMRAMTFSGKVVSFLHKCIVYRQQNS